MPILEVAVPGNPARAGENSKISRTGGRSGQTDEGYRVPVVMGDLGTIGKVGRELIGTQLFEESVVGSLVSSLQRETICGRMR